MQNPRAALERVIRFLELEPIHATIAPAPSQQNPAFPYNVLGRGLATLLGSRDRVNALRRAAHRLARQASSRWSTRCCGKRSHPCGRRIAATLITCFATTGLVWTPYRTRPRLVAELTVGMSVILAESSEALAILSREDFQSRWRELHTSCPWATAFQGATFALTWYRCYSEQFEPVLLYEFAADGRLIGLLTLARQRGSDRLVAVGSRQAEYQCWLALPESNDAFFDADRAPVPGAAPPITSSAIPPGKHAAGLRPAVEARAALDPASCPPLPIGRARPCRYPCRIPEEKRQQEPVQPTEAVGRREVVRDWLARRPECHLR